MSIFELFGVIVFLGLIVWGIQQLVPMSPPFQNALYVLSVVIIVFLFLNVFFGVGPAIQLWPGSWGHARAR
jgi:hypothetical protein